MEGRVWKSNDFPNGRGNISTGDFPAGKSPLCYTCSLMCLIFIFIFISSYIVAALKTLLLAARCYCEFTLIEKERGWELLVSCEDHHRGVGLIARVMLQTSYYYDILRILYLLVPFLERGDEEHQITGLAFFSELLCMSEARRLPKQYSLYRLKRGLANENPVIRALCIKGLVNIACWIGKEEVKIVLPAMTKSLTGMDGRLFVEAVAEIEKILVGPEGADCICEISLSLQELFSDERASVRAAAICLFGKMVKRAKKNNKHALRHQVLESLVPLLLHLQEEDPDISKECRYALNECFQFLGWKLPKQTVSRKAWPEHEEVLDETCQYLVCCLQVLDIAYINRHRFSRMSPSPVSRCQGLYPGCFACMQDMCSATEYKPFPVLH